LRSSFGFGVALAAVVGLAGCQTEQKPIPVMSIQLYEALPPGQKPSVFRDPDSHLSYPYNVHETDGLSRNPDDCARWGCIDNMSR
jgi:hypothetical protein